MIEAILRKGKIALRLVVVMSVLTGLIYPIVITLLAQALFSWEANGSFIMQQGIVIGSDLIGQPFTDKNYFWARPSATQPFAYNAALSNGSNLAQNNPALRERVATSVAAQRKGSPENKVLLPIDLVTASGSGLDPDISPQAAFYQVPRVAKARGLKEEQVNELVKNNIQPRTMGLLGEPRINVFRLNRALDNMRKE